MFEIIQCSIEKPSYVVNVREKYLRSGKFRGRNH